MILLLRGQISQLSRKRNISTDEARTPVMSAPYWASQFCMSAATNGRRQPPTFCQASLDCSSVFAADSSKLAPPSLPVEATLQMAALLLMTLGHFLHRRMTHSCSILWALKPLTSNSCSLFFRNCTAPSAPGNKSLMTSCRMQEMLFPDTVTLFGKKTNEGA